MLRCFFRGFTRDTLNFLLLEGLPAQGFDFGQVQGRGVLSAHQRKLICDPRLFLGQDALGLAGQLDLASLLADQRVLLALGPGARRLLALRRNSGDAELDVGLEPAQKPLLHELAKHDLHLASLRVNLVLKPEGQLADDLLEFLEDDLGPLDEHQVLAQNLVVPNLV